MALTFGMRSYGASGDSICKCLLTCIMTEMLTASPSYWSLGERLRMLDEEERVGMEDLDH